MNKGQFKVYHTYGNAGSVTGSSYESGAERSIATTVLDWEIISQDVAEGTSTIAWKFSIDCSTSSKYDSDCAYITVAGTVAPQYYRYETGGVYTTVSPAVTVPTTRIDDGEIKEVARGEFTVKHNSDGTKTLYSLRALITLTGVYDEDGTSVFNTSYSPDLGHPTFGGTYNVTLDTIVKQGVIKTAPNFNDEESPTITYAIPKESTEAYVGISVSGSMLIPYRSVSVSSSSYTFNFTQSEKDILWALLDRGINTTEARFYIKTTCNGQTLEDYEVRTLEIINYKPTLAPEVWDANTDVRDRLTGSEYILVRGVSKPAFKTGGEVHKGAELSVQYCRHGGVTLNGATGEFTTVSGDDTTASFDFGITDSRGNSEQAPTMQFSTTVGNYIPYVKLTTNVEVTDMTADGDVQIKITGKCFNGSFGKKTNRLRVFYDIVKNNEDDFNHVDLGYADYASNYGNSFYVNGNEYTYTLNISGLEYLSVYDFTVWVADEVATAGVSAFTVIASTPIFDWGRQDFNFNVPVSVQGNLDLNGNLDVSGTLKVGGYTMPTIVAQGTSSSWTYRKWSDGLYECWRTLSVTSAVATSTNANWYSSGELSTTNLTFPVTFIERPTTVVQTMPTGSSYCIVFPSNTTGSTTKTGSYQLMSMSSLTSRAHLLTYQVKGKWK